MISRAKNVWVFILVLSVLMLESCRSGYVFIEKQEDFADYKNKINKVVIIQPNFYESRNNKSYSDFGCLKKEKRLSKSFTRLTPRLGKEIIVAGAAENMDMDYFNGISRLKREILLAADVHDDQTKSPTWGRKVTQPLSTNLLVSPELISLQKQYGTPYFAYVYFVKNNGLNMTTVLADISQGKIIYRESRKLQVSSNPDNLDRMVFNSFLTMLLKK